MTSDNEKRCAHMLSGTSANGSYYCLRCGDVFDHTGKFIRRAALSQEKA